MASNATSSSTSDSTSSESPHNTHGLEKSLLGRMTKLREGKEKISPTIYKMKNEMKQDEELDENLMSELRANYYRLCAQEYEFLKVMQNQRPYQLISRNPTKRRDLALLNMCISILEIRQLQSTGNCCVNLQSGCNSASAYASQHCGQTPTNDQLETIRKNKEKIQLTLKNLEDSSEIDEELQRKMLAEMTADYYILKAQENEFNKQTQRENHNIEYLKKLREEKRRIILVLRSLRDNLSEDEEIDKTLVAEMLAKYDMLSFQEEELCRTTSDVESDNDRILGNRQHENLTDNCKTNDQQKVS